MKEEIERISKDLYQQWCLIADMIKINSIIIQQNANDKEINNWLTATIDIQNLFKGLRQKTLIFFRIQQRNQDEMSKNDFQSGKKNE